MGILLETRNPAEVVTLTLNRPAVRNALDTDLVRELTARLEVLAQDPTLRLLLLRGAAGTFCSGADLATMRAMAEAGPDENLAEAQRLLSLIERLNRFPVPTVAVIEGAAFGGALGLIAACDLALAAAGTRFALSEVRLGLIPALISPYIARAMGHRQLRRYMLTGELFDADQARQMGLVHLVAPTESLDAILAQWVEELLKGGPRAQRAAKMLLLRLRPTFPDEVRLADETIRLIAELRAGAEGREGLSAFLEKRRPAWRPAPPRS